MIFRHEVRRQYSVLSLKKARAHLDDFEIFQPSPCTYTMLTVSVKRVKFNNASRRKFCVQTKFYWYSLYLVMRTFANDIRHKYVFNFIMHLKRPYSSYAFEHDPSVKILTIPSIVIKALHSNDKLQ